MTRTAQPAHVLVVDDEEVLRRVLVRILSAAGYACSTATNVPEGRAVLDSQPVDLVLCDVNMPGENGFSLLQWASTHHPGTGVIMVTALADARAAAPAAEHGALGYILKPFEASEILINVATALSRRARERAVTEDAHSSRRDADERGRLLDEAVAKLALSQQTVLALNEEIVLRLATVAEWRDPYTGSHLRSMSDLSAQLAQAVGLAADRVDLVRVASLLHDLGKVAVPDSILLKAGPLTVDERAVMQEHAETGAAMLQGSDIEVLRTGGLIALTHHERWDGTGYPRGLTREDIPLEARIVSIADVFDALSSERPYKPAWEPDRVVATLRAARGSQFDPDLLDVFLDEVVR